MSKESQREQMRQWFKQHPEYYRQWTNDYQSWRDSERAAGRNVNGNSRPRIKGKLAYEVNVTNPLQADERGEVTTAAAAVNNKGGL